GPQILALLEADQVEIVGLSQLLQHPKHDRGARGGGMIERELRHLLLRRARTSTGGRRGSTAMWRPRGDTRARPPLYLALRADTIRARRPRSFAPAPPRSPA